MPHVVHPGQNSDAFANLAVDGDTIEFAAGQFNNNVTINARTNCRVFSNAAAQPPVITVAHDGVRIPRRPTGVKVENLAFKTSPKLSSACSVSGKGVTVSNIKQTGAGRILTMNSAEDLVADMLDGTVGNIEEYGIWGALDGGMPAHGPINCKIKRFDINITKGLHGIRVHKHTRLVIGDPVLSLKDINFAGRIRYSSPYDGAALTLKEGTHTQVIRVYTEGPVGFGPNDAELPTPLNHNLGTPGWQGLRLDRLHITGCHFKVGKRFFWAHAGTVNALIENTIIEADKDAACIRLDGKRGPKNEWPVSSGEFRKVTFLGAKLCDDSNRHLLANWKFTDCMLNNKKLGPHGEIVEQTTIAATPRVARV